MLVGEMKKLKRFYQMKNPFECIFSMDFASLYPSQMRFDTWSIRNEIRSRKIRKILSHV